MNAPPRAILRNHQRILDGLRRTLVHAAAGHQGDLRAALALAGDLARLVRDLDREEPLAPPAARRALVAARATVLSVRSSLAYAFSARAVLGGVDAVIGALDDVDRELRVPAALAA